MTKVYSPSSLTPDQHQTIIDELQDIIIRTIDLINRFESEGMEDIMRNDYEKLQDILDIAIQKQRKHRKFL